MSTPTSSVDLIDIVRSQARLETKVDLVLERLDKSDAAHERIRLRVDNLEREQARSKGFAAAIAAIAGVVTGIIVPLIKSKLGL